MTFVAVALALYLGFSGAIENTRVLFYQQAERMIDRLIGEIGDELDPVYRHAQEIAKRVESGNFDPENESEWRTAVAELPALCRKWTGWRSWVWICGAESTTTIKIWYRRRIFRCCRRPPSFLQRLLTRASLFG